MSLRVVLYAEGGGEDTGTVTSVPAPGSPLREEDMGPGHVFVLRCLSEQRGVPEAAIRFEAPLRYEGRLAHGSTLKRRVALRQLLTWLPARRPDVAVLLVDADKESDSALRKRLHEFVDDLPIEKAIGVARPEFEAWLIADTTCVARALGIPSLSTPPEPDGLDPGGAKRVWDDWIGRHAQSSRSDPKMVNKRLRLDVARGCVLQVVRERSSSFRAFSDEFRHRS